jgi:Leucine-rich repeat (LRR) protein
MGQTPVYNAYEVGKLREYFNAKSMTSSTCNGLMLSAGYNPNDPLTYPGVTWSSDATNKRATDISLNMSSWRSDYLNEIGVVLDISGFTMLKSFNLNIPSQSVVVKDCPLLESLYVTSWMNEIGYVSCSNLPSLTSAGITSANFSNRVKLDFSKSLGLSTFGVSSIDMGNVSFDKAKVTTLSLTGLSLDQFPYSDYPNVKTLTLYDNSLTSFDPAKLSSSLTHLNLSSNYLTLPALYAIKGTVPNFWYAPQNSVLVGNNKVVGSTSIRSINVDEILDLSSEYKVGSSVTNFVWKKSSDKTVITPKSSSSGKFTFGADLVGQAIYCEMRNTELPQFEGDFFLRTCDVYVGNTFNEYNPDEVTKLKAFLDQPSAVAGKTNGQQINSAYNPNDPSTFGVTWTKTTLDKRAESISWGWKNLSGDLDFSNFTQLCTFDVSVNKLKTANVSGCTMLSEFRVEANQLTSVDVSGCSQLSVFYCGENKLTSLDVSSLKKLTYLNVYYDSLKDLDLSSNKLLSYLRCDKNQFKFSTLPIKSSPTEYYYDPQGLIPIGKDITVNGSTFKHVGVGEAVDLSAEATIDGKATSFVWKKRSDGSVVTPATNDGGKFTFDSSLANETIYCEMSNATFPGFTGDDMLKTVDIAVGDSFNVYNAYEVGKLRAFLDQPSAVNGKSNGQQVNAAYDPNDPSTFGVSWIGTAFEKRATGIYWSGMSLSGDLDLSNFTQLNWFYVNSNRLKTANVRGCTKLNDLQVDSNQLTSVDVSGCSQLSGFVCGNNKLTSLNTGSLTKLTSLNAKDNTLKELNLSSNTLLKRLYCGNNQFKFSTLPVKSSLTEYTYSPQGLVAIGEDITKNGNTFKYVGINKVVDLSAEATIDGKATSFVWKKRSDGSMVTPATSDGGKFTFDVSLAGEVIYCEMSNTTFPDFTGNNTFKTVDVAVGDSFDAYNAYEVGKLRVFLDQPSAVAGKTNGQQVNAAYDPNDPSTFEVTWSGSVFEKRATSISWSGKSLSGYLDFSNFTQISWFYVYNNQLKTANLSGCTKLNNLQVDSNQLTSVDVSGCSQLSWFECENNKLTSLNAGSLIKLTTLKAYNNSLKGLDLSSSTLLSSLECGSNMLKFSTLPVKSNLTTYTYTPQALVTIGNDITVNGSTFKHVGVGEAIDLSAEATIDGKATTFVWKKRSDGSMVTPATSDGGKFTFDSSLANEAIYCEMSNATFPNLTADNTLKTVDVAVGDSFNAYNAYEVGKLRDFLDQPSAVDGKTNGQQVNAAYDPNDPSTFGVTWSGPAFEKRATIISWSGKSLSGYLDFSSFTQLGSLIVYSNQLKTVNLSGCTLLSSLVCGSNMLKFSTLPVKSNLTTYTYTPQGLVTIGEDITVNGTTFKHVGVGEAVDLSAEATIVGNATSFVWKKRSDGSVVTPATNNGGKFTFGVSLANETIYCEMSNASFPNFTGDNVLRTVDVVVGDTFSIYNADEVGKLQAFLDMPSSVAGKLNGQMVNSNYKANDPSTFGVSWSNSIFDKRVNSIYWSWYGLAGNLDLNNFTQLSYLNVSNNYLLNVNVSGATKLSSLWCAGNYLKFSTLPLSSPLFVNSYSYAPQKNILIARDTIINGYSQRYITTFKGLDLSSELTIGGNSTVYTWKKSSDNTVVTPLTSENGIFTFPENLAGQSIYCELVNPTFPNFVGQDVLKTETVLVEGRYNSNDVTKLKSFLQQESAISGQKNYQRIGLEVDLNDPSSWPLVEWTASSTNTRVKSIIWMRKDLAGNLDFSGLDSLKSVELTTNKITSATFSGCSKLEKIWLDENAITVINTSTLASLKELNVNYNRITQLDLSANTKLEKVEFASNLLSTVKLPNTPTLGSVRATRNNFKLSTLPPALSQYYSYFYQPQNPMVIGDAVQENGETIYKVGSYTTIDLSSELTIGGKTTSYSWYNVSKKTDITPKTLANGKFSFDSSVEGDVLICYMRNESLPDFSMLYPFETVKVLVTPGYNQYEVGKLKVFLDQPSAVEGKTNGQVVNAAYNSNDPSTFGITWTGAAIDKRAVNISWWGKNLSGDLDFSNFTQLIGLTISYSQLKTANLNGCALLSTLQLDNNQLISVDVSGCSQLSWFSCQSNKLTSLNVGSLTMLTSLNAQANTLKELELSSNTSLTSLKCGNNLLKFSTLPVKSSLTTYTYAPQGLVIIGDDITVNGTTFKHVGVGKVVDLSAEATIGDNATTFVWKKRSDGYVVTPATSDGGKFTFNASLANEIIYCEMSNVTFPSFTGNNTLKTVDVAVGTSFNAYNAYEVDKLKAFLNQPSAVAGKTNGQQVNSAYNPEDPSTYGVVWNSNLFDKKVTLIDWQSKSLSGSITLDKFSELVTFYLGDNGISSVDVSECAKLEGLHFERNQVTTLNVSGCSNLYLLVCDNNRLTNVDLSQVPNLVSFNAMRNQLTVVDFSANPKLQSIGLRGNQIENVEVNSLTQLKQLVVGENKIANLNLSNLSNLEVLWVDNNNLRLLDIAANPKLASLYYYNNSFTYSTLLGKPASVTAFGCAPQKLVEIGEKQISGTSEKYFIGADQVVDLSREDIVKGVQTTFTWKEQYGSVVTPTSSNGGKFTFNSKFVGEKLYCEMANAGFPDFVGYNILKTVVVEVVPAYNQNDVDKLKVFLNKPSQESGKTNGQQLNTAYNPEDPATYGVAWSRHNVNKRVINFQWYDKKLSGDLDLSGCELLNDVFISNNKIPSVNFKGCSSLVSLYAESNEIASASFDKHPLLESVDISLNKLTSLAIPEAPMLSYLFATGNKLTQINMSKMASLARVKLMNNELTAVDVAGLIKLEMLKLESNKISEVKFGGNEKLALVNLDNNQLSSIDVSSLSSLCNIMVSNNKLLLSVLPSKKVLYTSYGYAPQAPMAVGHVKQDGNDVKYSIYAEESFDLSSELNIGGNVTTFVWKKVDGTLVKPISSDHGVFKFSTDLIGEVIYGELSNNSFPDFVGDKIFKTVQFTVLSPYNEEEVAKLINFFNRPSSNGTTNGNIIGITKIGNPESWNGVEWTNEISDRRVVSINWHSLGLSDTLSLSDFIKLTSIDVSGNQLAKVVLTNTPLLKKGLFDNNKLKFSTMPTSTSFDEYSCFPQAKLEIGNKTENGVYTLMAGEYVDLSSEVVIEVQATTFTWKDEAGNTTIPTKGENGRFAFNSDFIGRKLYCELSNPKFPNGSIQTVVVTIFGSKFESKFGKEVDIAVYPNPASSILKFEIDEVIREYRIYSVRGVLVKTGTINDFKAEINVQTLTSGTYLLELTDGVKVYRSKFIKQ